MNVLSVGVWVLGWMRYVRGVDEKAQPFKVQDPLADELNKKANVSDDPSEVSSASKVPGPAVLKR